MNERVRVLVTYDTNAFDFLGMQKRFMTSLIESAKQRDKEFIPEMNVEYIDIKDLDIVSLLTEKGKEGVLPKAIYWYRKPEEVDGHKVLGREDLRKQKAEETFPNIISMNYGFELEAVYSNPKYNPTKEQYLLPERLKSDYRTNFKHTKAYLACFEENHWTGEFEFKVKEEIVTQFDLDYKFSCYNTGYASPKEASRKLQKELEDNSNRQRKMRQSQVRSIVARQRREQREFVRQNEIIENYLDEIDFGEMPFR